MLPARLRYTLCALAAAVVLVAGAQSVQVSAASHGRAASSLRIGISDDSAATFADPRFHWLGIKTARLVLPWDVTSNRAELSWQTAWLEAARTHGITPLIAFNMDPRHPRLLPSLLDYARAVTKFMKLFPWVHEYTPWNEENHPLQPTARDPHRAAQYFNLLTLLCRHCTITAADVLDIPNMEEWVRRFLHYAHHPRYWGLHNYRDLSSGEANNTLLFLSLVPGEVWFTEIGGVVWRYEKAGHNYVVHDESYAARVAGNLLGLASVSSRVRRIYYYQWHVTHTLEWAHRHGKLTWDSGLIRPDCATRPAFSVIARALGRIPSRVPRARHTRTGTCV